MCDVPSIPVTNYYWYDHTLPVPETLHLQSTLLLSLKVPGKQTPSPPPSSPTGPLWREMPVAGALLDVPLHELNLPTPEMKF